ncbi:MAG: 50S ribosomal protein L5 [Thermoplasmata archaeon]
MNNENPMRNIVIEKVVINIGVGEGGEKLKKAEKVIEILTGRKPVETISKNTIRDFNIRKRQPIGTKVTLRKKDAEEFLKRALWVKNFKLPQYSFDENGNLSFGIRDYTSFENVKYDPDIGIFGFDVNVKFKRKGGYRVQNREINSRSIPKRHRVKKEEVIEFMKKNFGIEILEVK